MPNVGGVYVPDELMPTMAAPASARPSLGTIIGASAEGTWKQLKAALPYQFEVLTRDKVDPGLEQQYQRGLADSAAAFARAPAASLDDATSGRVGVGRFIAENVAQSLPQMAGVIAGGVAGGLVGGAPGALAGATLVGTPIFSASNTARAVQENGSLDVTAAERAFAAAPVQAASDALIGRFLPGVGKFLGGAAATQTSTNFLRRTATSIAKAGATEAVTEAGQQLLERAAAGIPLGNADAVSEYVNAAVTAFAVGGVLGAAGGFRRTNAVAKPPEMVTNEDILEVVNGALDGSLRALPAPEQFGRSSTPQEEPLGLPAPPDIIGGADGVSRVNPSGTNVLALPAPEAPPALTVEDLPVQAQGALAAAATPAPAPLSASTSLSTQPGFEGFDPVAPPTPPATIASEAFRFGVPEVPFADTLAEVKKGVSTNQWVKKLDADDEFDLMGKVYEQIFTEQDTRTGTIKLAQRLGILNEDLTKGPVAEEVEARQAAATEGVAVSAPSSTAPAVSTSSTPVTVPVAAAPADIAAVVDAKKAIGVQRAGNLGSLNTPADVFAQLAVDRSAAKRDGDATRVEQLAKNLGLITNDDAMDVTPKGRQVFLQSPEGLEATVSAAADNGYAGAAASQFDRGARAELGGQEQTTFSDFEEMAAYNAGKVWAKDFVANGEVKTAEQTTGIRARQDARKTGTAVARGSVERAPLTPLQLQQQSLNSLLDAADLRAVNDSDVAMLRRMARDGATPTEIGTALQQVQGGKSLFKERAEASTPVAFSPMPTRGGQPAFREMRNDPVMLAAAQQRAKTTGEFPAQMSGLTADVELEQRLAGKDFLEVAAELERSAPTAFDKLVMKGVRKLAFRLANAGAKLEFRLLQPGDEQPAVLQRLGARGGVTHSISPMTSTVWLKSSQVADGGVSYQVAAHEMVHAVTTAIVHLADLRPITGALGQAAANLRALTESIQDHLEARRAAGSLNEFEQQYAATETNALENQYEILAWGLTNPQMQEYLAGQQYAPRQSVFGRLVELVRDLLGLKAQHDTALGELLRVSTQIFDTDRAELVSYIARNNPDVLENAMVAANNTTAPAINETLKNFAALSDKVLDTLTPADFKQKARRVMLRWLSAKQLIRLFGGIAPGIEKWRDAHRWRDAVRGNFEAMGDDVYQAFEKLERENKNAAEWVGQLMATSTEFQVDPDKAWDEHTHIAEKDRARIKPMYDAAVKLKNDLSRGDGAGIKVFNQFRAFNEAQNYARLAAGLHHLVAMDPELKLGVNDALLNPAEAFLEQEGLTAGTAVRDWWQKTLLQQITATTDFVNAKKGEAETGTENEKRALRQHLSPIEMQISAIHEAMAGMQKAPYFHLGRFGDYFASAKVRTNADGTVDVARLEKVATAIAAAGFDDVKISEGNNRPKIVMRFDTNDQAQRFKALMQQMHAEGHLEGDLKDAVQVGARSRENNYGQTDGFPTFVQNYIEAIEASPIYAPDANATPDERAALERRKDEAIRLAMDTWLEAQPDTSISKVLTKRHTVPGYKKDMVRNFAHRWRVGSISLANIASAPKFADAFVDMRSAVEEAKAGDSTADQPLLNDLLAELKARDASVPLNDNADTFDKVRAISHSYFLGMSPAYAMINMTQLGVAGLPELAKKHGYSKSFHAMRRASADALKIVKAAGAEASKLGPQHWADVAITQDVLTKAGLSAETARFALRMIASGTIDIGSQARALGQVNENRTGSKLDMSLKYASALGMYSETFSRLTMALAAHELHGGDLDSAAKYATDVVSNSMFDYQSWNTARALGKKGVLGPVTPIVTQFMSYSVQMTEKLFSEFSAAIGRPRAGDTVEQALERKREARTFLLGHLTAIVALTGTLGLPFMTVFATVLERLIDDDDDGEPFDITAAYRGFLADTLGKDVAEVVTRGLPRLAGFDLSARAGEQNLLPFSEFFADRRPWKEAIEANTGRSLGAVPSMISNIISGGGKIADGDWLAGSKEMLPVAFKGPIEAYRMSGEGYVDGQGNKLPMSPRAAAMVWQLLGLTPAEKAEYSEARSDLQSRKGEVTRRAGVLRDGIVKALLQRDTAMANQLLAEAQEFDKDNPSVGLVNSVPAALQRRVMGGVNASALRTPLGVSMNDIAGQQMARYANVGYTQ